jgi:serine-type D-Ala-D-Ala carboxypeptidase
MEESWHIRYVGEDTAKTIHEKNISLEEYLNAPGGDYVN